MRVIPRADVPVSSALNRKDYVGNLIWITVVTLLPGLLFKISQAYFLPRI